MKVEVVCLDEHLRILCLGTDSLMVPGTRYLPEHGNDVWATATEAVSATTGGAVQLDPAGSPTATATRPSANGPVWVVQCEIPACTKLPPGVRLLPVDEVSAARDK